MSVDQAPMEITQLGHGGELPSVWHWACLCNLDIAFCGTACPTDAFDCPDDALCVMCQDVVERTDGRCPRCGSR